MKAVKEKAYAKINFYLDVVGKRADGFHDIKTIMHSVSLFDTLTVETFPSRSADVSMRVVGGSRLPTDDRNIAVKAARLYLERARIEDGIRIILQKNIPVASGLAGGSTDAAAVLRALNRLYGNRFSQKALISLAAEIGSDVPYCIGGGTALCYGRGEQIERLPDINGLNFVIAIADNEYVSTPAAYSVLDSLYSNFDRSAKNSGKAIFQRFISSVKNKSIDASLLYNIFEEAILPNCRGALTIKERRIDLGARGALMSGSGPSVFGVFDTAEAAKDAEQELTSCGYRAFVAHSV